MKHLRRIASLFFLLVAFVFSWQGALPTDGQAAESIAEYATELLRQQLETWKTPPELELTPIPEEAVPSNAIVDTANAGTDTKKTTQVSPATVVRAARLETPATPPRPKLMVGNEVLRTAVMLARFYEERGYRLAWNTDSGPLPHAAVLLDAIQAQAEREGLQARNYRLEKIRTILQDLQQKETTPASLDPRALAEFDLLLTDTFLLYGAHVSLGAPKWNALDAQWFFDRQKTDVALALQHALATNNIEGTLKSLSPHHAGYLKLRDALAWHRESAARGGWPQIPSGFDLHPGEHDPRVAQLRARLQVTGEFVPTPSRKRGSANKQAGNKKEQKNTPSGDPTYDPTLVQAVKRFQKKHGLAADGVIGGRTLATLNVSIETRIRQISENMQRWRELPQHLGGRYVAVNIPNFTLDVIEDGQSALHMKVVVGKMVEKRHTPTFSASMAYLVLNPYWHVPTSIAEKELFPLSKKDPEYFAKNNFVVHRVAVGEKPAPALKATDGTTMSKPIYQYRLKQAPGPKNALGRVKFIFPNPHGVYLHDTPSKEMFNRSVRTYSHGCIRVEKPIDLAEYLLHGTEKWTRSAILATIARAKEKIISLPEEVPVYIQYWTAWVDDEGTVQFRNDIYGYDHAPEAQLPVDPPKNPRPQPTPEDQPVLQEVRSPQEEPPTAQPASQPESPATLLEPPLTPLVEEGQRAM